MKRTELERKTPLKRKTPIARKKPSVRTEAVKVRTPIRKKKPSVAAAQYAQRRQLNIRSGGRCEMEIRIPGGVLWIRCFNGAQDSAHVYKRPKCGKARDLVDTVVHSCRRCHAATEGGLGTSFIRIPYARAVAAWGAILAHSKLGTDNEADRIRIHIGSVGLRPEKGFPPYD